MKLSKRLVSLFLSLVLILTMLSVAAVSASAADAENDNPFSVAAMNLDKEYAYDGELGAIYSPDATTFKVWAPLATDVKLNLYATGSDAEEGAKDLGTYEMSKLNDGAKWTGVWTYSVASDLKNTYYTYSITNPTHIYYGDGAKPEYLTRETQDVYSYAVGVNGDRSMVIDLDSTDPEGWDADSHVFVDHQSEAIIWEVQVKDFSYNPNSGVSEANRGKYLAFTETGTTLDNEGVLSTGIDYLKQLGVTHVQINPFYDFATIDEARNVTDDSEFNWGYDPKNYGVPEGSYSSDPYNGNVRVNEAKQMIQALHEAGIGVIMDVVYNHTYSIDSCFNYSVPEYYYRMTATGGYSQQSGCGNDTASERAMYRKYMREMLAYWTNEYHIDGYRFDLMGVHDGETMNMIREDMDAIDSRIIMYGEGWAGDTVYDPQTCSGTDTFMTVQGNTDKLSTRIGFFNDQIRDGIKAGVFADPGTKGFVSGNKVYGKNISMGVRANTTGHGTWSAITPEQCVTYASCHDNKTLYDTLVESNHSGATNYRARYSDVITQNKFTAAIISSCQGIDFILAGEEMGRSKDGDHNSYKSAATLNMIDWSLIKSNADLVSYYKGMFELRKAFSPFTASLTDATDDDYAYHFDTMASSSLDTICYTIENNTPGEWDKVLVIYNAKKNTANYTFKRTEDKSITADTEWVVVANDKIAGVTALDTVKGLDFKVAPSSALIAVEKSTFEKCAISSDLSRVVVNSIYKPTGALLSSNTILGTPGSGYATTADGSIPIKYELSSIDGDENGVFTDKDIVVNYEYENYVPASLTPAYGDVDDDGDVSIFDATRIQRYLADMTVLDEEHIRRGDYDYNGKTEIFDVSLLQRYLADFEINTCTIKTNYYALKEDGTTTTLSPSTTATVRLGDSYTTTPASVAYYVVDETPANASGIASENTVVNYYYVYKVQSPIIHIKHNGDQTWDPSLWAWAYDNDRKAINAYSGWPGKTLTTKDDDGWYTTTFPIPGGLDYYIIVSKNGNPQTADYGPIKYDDYPEIWVIIDDEEVGKSGEWISYYNYNPETAD